MVVHLGVVRVSLILWRDMGSGPPSKARSRTAVAIAIASTCKHVSDIVPPTYG